METAVVQVVPWCVGIVLDTSCGGVLQFGIEVLVKVPSCALACAAEVRGVPWQSLAGTALVLAVPGQSSVSGAVLVRAVPRPSSCSCSPRVCSRWYLSVPVMHSACAVHWCGCAVGAALVRVVPGQSFVLCAVLARAVPEQSVSHLSVTWL